MAKKIHEILIEIGFDAVQAGTFIKTLKKIDKIGKTNEEKAAYLISKLYDSIEPAAVKLDATDEEITKWFVCPTKVNQRQLDEIRLRYPEEQIKKPKSPWYSIVKELIEEVSQEDYSFIVLSEELILNVAKTLGHETLSDKIINEVKTLYNQCTFLDKERCKGTLIKQYIASAVQYL